MPTHLVSDEQDTYTVCGIRTRDAAVITEKPTKATCAECRRMYAAWTNEK